MNIYGIRFKIDFIILMYYIFKNKNQEINELKEVIKNISLNDINAILK